MAAKKRSKTAKKSRKLGSTKLHRRTLTRDRLGRADVLGRADSILGREDAVLGREEGALGREI